jgi:prepilin-type N-terminal cleavage/methylation domain-containing protein
MFRSKPPTGFTLIEVLIALTVFTIGVLAMAGSAARITQMLSAGRRDLAAAVAAGSRIESLHGRACQGVVSGEESRDRMVVRWTVTGLDARSRRVRVLVERPGRVEYVISTAVACTA